MIKLFEAVDLEGYDEVSDFILSFLPQTNTFCFYGDLGAGKTTFVKALCAQLGIEDALSSPSFSIVNEYQSSTTSQQVYHMDLYRLKSIDEAESIGLHEYLDSGNYCFIEWPELIEHFLPADVIKISIRTEGNIRNVSIFKD